AIWLLPFYPSPLKDDGYDIADYYSVNPTYGSIRDVRRLVKEAHRRGLKVITEMVCNHTSDQHPWFQRARKAKPGTPWRDYYVWSGTNHLYENVRIIFKDFEVSNWTWDHEANAYYWHRFYSHQPDLNFRNPSVQREILKVIDFWMEMGIDGLRLDAIPYLFEREGTTCENLPETHQFLKTLRAHIDSKFQNRMLLAEANQWPEDAAAYFGDGDESNMCFHFPLMPRLFMGLRMEDRFPIVDILAQTPPIPEEAQWALFLRNHDELTLEMVTDEERDYMYRVYSEDPDARINLGIRRRLAPLMANNRRRIELMNGLLFSLPGTPFIYYGDEIGMGDNIYLGDRNGVRTPMQWSPDRNAGFSTGNRQRLFQPVIVDPEYHYEAVNVEAQQGNAQSLLSWMKRLIALRKQYQAFGRGSFEPLHPDNRKVLAFIRRHQDELILVIANLSRFSQAAELDLRAFEGLVPVEMFGRTEFPPIGELPYFVTMGPHGFYWFSLEPQRTPNLNQPTVGSDLDIPEIVLADSWDRLFSGTERNRLEEVLPSYLQTRRWFGGKARRMRRTLVVDNLEVPSPAGMAHLLLIEVQYADGDPDHYLLPLACMEGDWPSLLDRVARETVLARSDVNGVTGLIYDATASPAFANALLQTIQNRGRLKGADGVLAGCPAPAFSALKGPSEDRLEPSISKVEQSNNSVVFGERLILKVFRRVEEGVNPELEIGRRLTEDGRFLQIPQLAGWLEYRPSHGGVNTAAVLQAYVPSQCDGWQQAQAEFDHYLDHAGRRFIEGHPPPLMAGSVAGWVTEEASAEARAAVGNYVDVVGLLGRRTAEMHLALATQTTDPAFTPEPSTMLEQRSAYQSIRALGLEAFSALRANLAAIPAASQSDARALLDLEGEVLARVRGVLERPLTARRIRGHGDYHLGQVLFTGHDFVIVDFEGEPARSISERRRKRWAAKDVAAMARSFDYVAQVALLNRSGRPIEQGRMQVAANLWVGTVTSVFLRAYRAVAGGEPLLSRTLEEDIVLLETMLMEKALYELRYELNNRPAWVGIPLRGVLSLIGAAT
ncbi:MAG TPA: maltose alpha-D-glucosyltransferase, partial [Candidatus Dormibacteraeota bacterium]|nr:maltose alpha-D-glucosyltransferase [Candidatus Dormibacteraeota bacterium]